MATAKTITAKTATVRPKAAPPKPDEPASYVPLPKSVRDALPAASVIMRHVEAIVATLPQLEQELKAAERTSITQVARAYAVLHRLRELILSDERSRLKPLGQLFERYSKERMPALFEQAGVTHLPLAEGLRVGVAYAFRASIKKDKRKEAYLWLQDNQLSDLIINTVNASSLSAALKALRDEHNMEAPAEWFNAADVPYTSVTKT
jgi:hypothetical protein